jgi:hypothetical protein
MFFAVTALLCLWFLVSIAHQFPAITRIAEHNGSQLIPYWGFFCSNPPDSDWHLIYRVLGTGGRVRGWKEITCSKPRPFLSSVWNPELRVQNVLVHSAMTVHVTDGAGSSPSYAFLLSLATARCLNEGDGGFIQFAVVDAPSFTFQKQPSLVLKSGFHALS